jgi:hypothetical protein
MVKLQKKHVMAAIQVIVLLVVEQIIYLAMMQTKKATQQEKVALQE